MIKDTTQDSQDVLQFASVIAVVIYVSFYAFESPIRYVLNLAGLDPLIFLRDIFVLLVIALTFLYQLFEKKLSPYFFVYFFIIGFHGLVMIINTGSIIAVVYTAKVFMTFLLGAIAYSSITKPTRKMLMYYLIVWVVSVVFIFLNKYFLEFPWADMTTEMMGVEVKVSRDWTLTGAAKRAAGLYRASINAAMLVPLISMILIFNFRSFLIRLIIIAITIFTLYLTTMKGALVSFIIVSILILLSWAIKFIHTGRAWTFIALIFMVLFPIVLPGYYMPEAEGQFSTSSFNMRVEQMWPEAWYWINHAGMFPFGVGLGGISGAQRFYAIDHFNAADNMYVFFYASFGVLTFFYLGWVLSLLLRLNNNDISKSTNTCIAILAFLMGYGIVLSIVEDQMCALFIGAALNALSCRIKTRREVESNNLITK